MRYKQDVFRSRGIRYNKKDGKMFMKLYNEPKYDVINVNEVLKELATKLEYFEHSVDQSGKVDSVNYHTDCTTMDCDIPEGTKGMGIEEIRTLFDTSFRAYTIGYRLSKDKIVGRSIYYYPTVWKGNRYGLKGITNTSIIKEEIARFAEKIHTITEVKAEIEAFASVIEKFKGCCITTSLNGDLSYKIYGRVANVDLVSYFKGMLDIKKLTEMYGETALCCIRLTTEEVIGYNLYYLK